MGRRKKSTFRVAWVAGISCALLAPAAAKADAATEKAVAELFDHAVASPTALRVLLQPMPKGGDLHNHLGGSVYAEDYLKWAATAGLCVDDTGLVLQRPPCPANRTVSALAEDRPFAYARLVDHLSTRGWQNGIGRNDVSGHTQFFSSFDKFGPAAENDVANALAATLRIAAGDNLSYVELDHDPHALVEFTRTAPAVPLDANGLAARYQQDAGALEGAVHKAIAQLDADEAEMKRSMACGTPAAEPGCAVALHYLSFAWRAAPPAQAFRSLAAAFAIADRDTRFVGVNIVEPEDWPVSLRDYDLHMAMFRFLAAKYPRVKISMHAGELAFGMVPPADMQSHIAKAVAAGARRIGHGTGIAYEDDARGTMARMAREGIAVEINLTSNAVILGVSGVDHPLRLYRGMGVPVVLSTDDEGVLRTDMTNEYVRAAREQGLRYVDLKGLARASLEYAFLPGDSLWVSGKPGTPIAECARSLADASCGRVLVRSEKARLQADLERRFARFEQAALASPQAPS